jgi:hypothetical protein
MDNNNVYYIHFEINGFSCNLIGSQECDFSTNRTHSSAIRAEIALLWTNHIRVLTSANKSYLIIGFKQPIKLNKNVIWAKTKNLQMSWFSYFRVPKQFFAADKKQTNMDCYSKLSKNCTEFYIFWNFKIVTG